MKKNYFEVENVHLIPTEHQKKGLILQVLQERRVSFLLHFYSERSYRGCFYISITSLFFLLVDAQECFILVLFVVEHLYICNNIRFDLSSGSGSGA